MMTARNLDIVVVGASAGGVQPILRLFEMLDHVEAAFFLATHRSTQHALVDILRGKCPLNVESAEHAGKIELGRVYVCPADHNLSIEHRFMRVERSPKQANYRPSIDTLFRTAASAYGRRVAGVVLSGLRDDGTSGLWEIKRRGGIAFAQVPSEAQFPYMPQSAIDNVEVDYVLPIDEIAKKLSLLAKGEMERSHSPVSVLVVEDETIVADDVSQGLERSGYEVSGKVRSAEAAIKAVATACPSVVLMDIRLAGILSGADAARVIWERFQVPVVYLTAHSDRETLDQVKSSGGHGFVMKPFRAEAVHAAIELALDRREREAGF